MMSYDVHDYLFDLRGYLILRQAVEPDLIDDLARGEVADPPHLARGAERAGHGTAGLGRDADGVALAVMRHEHGLDVMAVV